MDSFPPDVRLSAAWDVSLDTALLAITGRPSPPPQAPGPPWGSCWGPRTRALSGLGCVAAREASGEQLGWLCVGSAQGACIGHLLLGPRGSG